MIGHYRVLRPLGAGGMAEVFLAQDTRLERPVALKLLSAELARDPAKRKRFRQEARAASGLAHPNICVIHEVGETPDGRPFLAMEYIDGQGLDRLLHQGRLTLREVLKVGLGVAEALDAAHARQIVHRDIKPGNIMLDRRGQVKVLDFGLAKHLAPHDPSATSSSVHTRSGFLLGTPVYMSPEQLLGRDLDPRTDLFSLGAVLYEAVAGQRPFVGLTLAEIINNVINQRPHPLGLETPRSMPSLEGIIFKCLEKDPQKRYSCAKALAEDLRRLSDALDRSTVNEAGALEAVPAPQPAPAAKKPWSLLRERKGRLQLALASTVAVVLVALAGTLWLSSKPRSRSAAAGTKVSPRTAVQKSIAVLPFDNFSGEPDTDYLSDGLTEEITAALARIPDLKVAARNSAFTFKGKRQDARKVAQALRVGTLLEGSLRKAGAHVRVTAELVNAADGFQLWSETYEGSLDDLFGVQRDIAQRIAARLQGETTGAPPPVRKVDPQAYQLYLRGRFFWNNRTEPDLRRAIDLFQEATVRDPAWADAQAGLAAAYFVLQLNSWEAQPGEFRPLARAAAERALQLDPACAEAEAVLGEIQNYARDFPGSEAHFRRAIQLAPNDATVHQWYGLYFLYRGHLEAAWPELQKAADLDPLSPVMRSCVIQWYFFHRDFDETIRQARQALEQFPDFPNLSSILIEAQLRKGQFQEALVEVDRARALQPGEPLLFLQFRAYALARLGRVAEARNILDQLEQLRAQGKRVHDAIALIYLGLREYDHALAALEQLRLAEGLIGMVFTDPQLDELREQPGFQALAERADFKK